MQFSPQIKRTDFRGKITTTAGYAHLADEHLLEATEKVGSLIAQAIMT